MRPKSILILSISSIASISLLIWYLRDIESSPAVESENKFNRSQAIRTDGNPVVVIEPDEGGSAAERTVGSKPNATAEGGLQDTQSVDQLRAEALAASQEFIKLRKERAELDEALVGNSNVLISYFAVTNDDERKRRSKVLAELRTVESLLAAHMALNDQTNYALIQGADSPSVRSYLAKTVNLFDALVGVSDGGQTLGSSERLSLYKAAIEERTMAASEKVEELITVNSVPDAVVSTIEVERSHHFLSKIVLASGGATSVL